MGPAGTTPQPARERILDAAFRLFYAHGPRGAGVDTVIAESGVAKATLYKHFPRKDDLVLAYLDKVDQAWFGALRAAARDAGDNPRDQLIGTFDALDTACRREGYHGCAFINTAAESITGSDVHALSLIHISEPTRQAEISYAVFCLKKKKHIKSITKPQKKKQKTKSTN